MAFPDASFAPSFSSVSFSGFSFYLGSEEPTDTARSGVWRLQLVKLQEEALAKRKEAVSEAVDKVIPPEKPRKAVEKVKQTPPVEVTNDKVSEAPKTTLKPLFKPLAAETPDNFDLLLETWAIISFTRLEVLQTQHKIKDLLSQINETEEDEDLEILLLFT